MMLKLQVISSNNFLREALQSYNIANFHLITPNNSLGQDCVTIQDKETELEITADGVVEKLEKPLKLEKLITLLLKIYTTYKVKLGSLTFMPSKRIIYNELGDQAELTEKEAQIISLLYLSQDSSLSNSELNAKVFDYNDETNSNALESHIYRLRQKLSSLTPNQILETIPGGYRILL